MIQEDRLIEIIKLLKKNDYKVERDGGAPDSEGWATGVMKIKYKDSSKKHCIVHEIELGRVENIEDLLIERFGL